MPTAPRRPGRKLRALLLGAVACAALAPAPAANAGLLSGTLLDSGVKGLVTTTLSSVADGSVLSGECGTRALQTRFAAWNDYANYFRVPASTAWSQRGSVQLGNGGFVLGSGASLTTPAVCVGLDAPSFRWIGSSPDRGVVRVDVVLDNGLALTAGRYTLGTAAMPSPTALVVANLLAVIGHDFSADVRIRFVVESGTARLDELWVDPFRRV